MRRLWDPVRPVPLHRGHPAGQVDPARQGDTSGPGGNGQNRDRRRTSTGADGGRYRLIASRRSHDLVPHDTVQRVLGNNLRRLRGLAPGLDETRVALTALVTRGFVPSGMCNPAGGRGTSWLDVNLVTWPGRCAIVRFVAGTMIAVTGGEVWADDSGGGGAPVVLLHPGVGDSRIWEPVLPALTASWRVIRYDARGFGRSPAPAVTFSLLADLITVLDYFGLDRVAIGGCSQGGSSALGLAVDHPARVSALVLLCPGVPGYPWPEEPDDGLDAEYERALEAGDVEALAGLMQRVWAAAGPAPAVMEQLRSAARAEISSGDLQQQDPPVFDRLGEISV